MLKTIKRILQKFRPTSAYQSLNTIRISTSRISQNLSVVQHLQPHHILIPVIKSNAYGHGIRQMCTIFNSIKNIHLPLLAVDSYPEYQIVADRTDKNILVLGETLSENYHLYDSHRTHLAIGSITTLKALLDTKKRWNIHLFLNTGMNREGFKEPELKEALELLAGNKSIIILGVMSHLANADLIDNTTTDSQINVFKKLYSLIKDQGHAPSYIHIANSAGISKIQDPLFTASRMGLAMYGYNPLEKSDPHYHKYEGLQPALQINSTITAIQHLEAGEGASYGLQWTTDKKTTLATLPFGYNEGLPRSAGDGYEVYHDNTALRVRGKVCMNLCSCELGNHNMSIGDQIEIIGRDENKNNTIGQLARISQTIPYTILTGLDRGLKRVIVE